MDDEVYESLRRSSENDEWEFKKFSVSAIYALIAASWIIFQEAEKKKIELNLLSWGICIGIIYLAIRTIRQFFNTQHSRLILNEVVDDEEAGRQPRHEDFRWDRTLWGIFSQFLYFLEPICIVVSFVIFVIDASKFLNF